jgi:hypothetical protein
MIVASSHNRLFLSRGWKLDEHEKIEIFEKTVSH